MTTINKARPSYARIKIQIDLKAYLSKYVKVEIENEYTLEIQVENDKVQYDVLSNTVRNMNYRVMMRINLG